MKPPATRSRSADVSTIHLADLLPPRQKTQMQRYRDLSSSLGPFNFRNIVLFSRTARSSVRTTHKRSRTRLSLRGFAIEHLVTGVTAERAYAFCEVDLIPQLAPIAGRKAPFFALKRPGFSGGSYL